MVESNRGELPVAEYPRLADGADRGGGGTGSRFVQALAVVALLLTLVSPVLAAGGTDAASDPNEVATPGVDPEAEAVRDPTEELFGRKCASCHTIGKGARVGPDLKGAHTRRAPDWLKRFIRVPSEMLDVDADAQKLLRESNGVRMPDLGLTEEQAEAMVALVERCSSEVCDLTPAFTPVTAATAADFQRGEDLFLGLDLLKNGGPPCVVCHSVSRLHGYYAGGGTLAKNLSHVFARFGDEGMDAALRSPPFALMQKIFQEHPLEDDEVFALRSFFYDANLRPANQAGSGISFVFMGILGALLMLILLNVAWSRRLRAVREPLLNGREPN